MGITRDFDAHKRMLEVSRHRKWLYVEGKDDIAFADRLLGAREDGGEFEIASADELESDKKTGGKQKLLAFERAIADAAGERELPQLVIVLDKDLDDVASRMSKSPRLVYTEGYSVENYLVRYGALQRSLAAVLNKRTQAVAACIPSSAGWIASTANSMGEWLIYSVFVARHCKDCPPSKTCGLDRPPFYDGYTFTPKAQVQNELWKRAAQASGLGQKWVARYRLRLTAWIRRLCTSDAIDRIANGKLLLAYAIMGCGVEPTKPLKRALRASLLVTLDCKGPWANGLLTRIDQALLCQKAE